MSGWRLSDEQLRAWIASLLAHDGRVVAPVSEHGLLLFREISSAEQARIEPQDRTRWSAKEHLLPATERLFSYRFEAGRFALEEPSQPPAQVLLGLRPCDAAGTARLDEVLGDDEIYALRRERTTIVSVACAGAGPACFCTAVGGSPAGTEASDVQLVSLGGAWLLCPLTERGAAIVDGDGVGWAEASEDDWRRAEEQRRAVEEAIGAEAMDPDWAKGLAEQFDSPLWQVLGERCLGCGICAYVCPSCSCFDVTDTGNTACGSRCRSWDSCGFAQFTKHAAGYNPRPERPSRYRQRVLHKFAWFPLEHGSFMCVGCGRCVELCPVGIDIHRSVEQLHSETRLTSVEGAATA